MSNNEYDVARMMAIGMFTEFSKSDGVSMDNVFAIEKEFMDAVDKKLADADGDIAKTEVLAGITLFSLALSSRIAKEDPA